MIKFGARVFLQHSGSRQVLLIKQTIKRGQGQNDEYSIDNSAGEHQERHVELTDDAGIAAAIRQAVAGKLSESRNSR